MPARLPAQGRLVAREVTEPDDAFIIANALTKADTVARAILSFCRLTKKDEKRILQALVYFTTKLQEAKASSNLDHVRIEDIVDLLREAEKLGEPMLGEIVSLAVLQERVNGPLLLQKVAIESLGCTLASLINFHPQLVARGDFAWLLDVETIDYPTSELLQMVQESVRAGPWYSDDDNNDSFDLEDAQVNTEFHQENCVHRGGIASNQLHGLVDKPPEVSKDARSHEEIRCRLSGYCGLAGILPHWETRGQPAVRRRGNTTISILMYQESLALGKQHSSLHPASTSLSENDTNTFDPDISRMPLSPSSTSWTEIEDPFRLTEAQTKQIHLLHNAMTRFCIAANFLQCNKYCCNAFTLVVSRAELDSQIPGVDMVRIKFQSLEDFRQSVLVLWIQIADKFSKINLADLKTCSSIGQKILSIFGHSQDTSEILSGRTQGLLSVDYHLHVCSLATQLLGLGLVSYTQGHKGPLSSPFDHDLTEIELLGTGDDRMFIKASLRELTCLGEMVGGPIFVFHLVCSSRNFAISIISPDLAVDFRCRGVDLIDTWGPGIFVSKAGAPYGSQLHAIEIGGGVIQPVRSDSLNYDPTKPLFHWSSQLNSYNEMRSYPTFSSWDEIQIGAISIRSSCPLESEKCRKSSQQLLCNLGTQASYWELAERQVTFQAGYYTVLQVGNMYVRKLGRTVKQQIIEQWSLLPNLRQLAVPWGLQISLCTGIAKRASLRKIIEDSMFAHVDTLKYEQWHKMLPGARVAFQGSMDLKAYIEGLSSDEKCCLVAIIGYILELLKPTGVDRKGEQFSILWPDALSTSYGVKIPCNEKNAWTRILQDSESCATFAAVTSTCFEGHNHTCRDMVAPKWQDCNGFLSTAVCHDLTAAERAKTHNPFKWLKDDQRYWVGKVGGNFWVIARRSKDGDMHLLVKCNRFPKILSQKLVGRDVIRERPDVSFNAEDVLVLGE